MSLQIFCPHAQAYAPSNSLRPEDTPLAPGTTVRVLCASDSIVSHSTPHQRVFPVMSPAERAMSPARMGGNTLSTSPLIVSKSVLSAIARASSDLTSELLRYSMMPL